MAHVRKEGRLGAVGGFGTFTGFAKLLFAYHLFGDIERERNKVTVPRASIHQLDVSAVPNLQNSAFDPVLTAPFDHFFLPDAGAHATSVDDAFFGQKCEEIFKRDAGAHHFKAVKYRKVRPVGRDHPFVRAKDGKTVANGL